MIQLLQSFSVLTFQLRNLCRWEQGDISCNIVTLRTSNCKKKALPTITPDLQLFAICLPRKSVGMIMQMLAWFRCFGLEQEVRGMYLE